MRYSTDVMFRKRVDEAWTLTRNLLTIGVNLNLTTSTSSTSSPFILIFVVQAHFVTPKPPSWTPHYSHPWHANYPIPASRTTLTFLVSSPSTAMSCVPVVLSMTSRQVKGDQQSHPRRRVVLPLWEDLHDPVSVCLLDLPRMMGLAMRR